MYNDVRKASEVHRAVRKYIKTIAVPGVKLIDMCETLENSVRKLIEEKGLQVRPRGRGHDAGDQACRMRAFSAFRLFCFSVLLSALYGRPHYRVTGVPSSWQPRSAQARPD